MVLFCFTSSDEPLMRYHVYPRLKIVTKSATC